MKMDEAREFDLKGVSPLSGGNTCIKNKMQSASPCHHFAMAFHNWIKPNKSTIASNSGETQQITSIGVANAIAVDDGRDSDWQRLAVYGSHPHKMGIQRFGKSEGESIVQTFRGALARIQRALLGSAKIPIYRGHPDDPQFAVSNGHDDTTVYGRVTNMDAREDGLWIQRQLTEAGKKLLSQGQKLYYSPRWLQWMRPDGHHPYKLLSVGMVPAPNIAGSAANSKTENKFMEKEIITKVLQLLGYPDEQCTAAANATDGAPPTEEVLEKLDGIAKERDSWELKRHHLQQALDTVTASNSKTQQALDTANAALKAERRDRATGVVDKLIQEGSVSVADKNASIETLCNSNDFVAAANGMSSQDTGLGKGSLHTQDLGDRKTPYCANANAKDNQISDQMAKHQTNGMSYDAAWQKTKQDNPALFNL